MMCWLRSNEVLTSGAFCSTVSFLANICIQYIRTYVHTCTHIHTYVHTCAASGMVVKGTGLVWTSLLTSFTTTSKFLNLT